MEFQSIGGHKMKRNTLSIGLSVIFIGVAMIFSGCGIPGKAAGGGFISPAACYE
jgi:hypothetical protein